MKRISYIYKVSSCLLLVLWLFASCTDDILSVYGEKGTEVKTDATSDIDWQPGIVLFELKQSPGASTRAAADCVTHAKIFSDGDVKVEQLFDMTNQYASLKRRLGLDRWFVAKFDEDRDVNEVLRELKKDPAISKVHGSLKVVPTAMSYTPATRAAIQPSQLVALNDGTGGNNNFNDPYLKYQWHYMTTNDAVYDFKVGADINLFPAWQKEKGDKHVVVAIIDSGVDFGHEDLKGSEWTEIVDGKEIHGRNFYNADNGLDPNIIVPGYHGTHVAGTIAARNNNGIGVSGIAGGNGKGDSGVRLMSCEIYGPDIPQSKAATIPSIVRAFEFAAEHGALICNCSWGFQFEREKHLNNENFQKMYASTFEALKKGIDYFTKYAGCDTNGNPKADTYMKGGLVFFASGNDGQDDIEMIPSSYENVIAVGAFDSKKVPTDYMDKGSWVDILAPGGVTDPYAPTGILSTVPAHFYDFSLSDKMQGSDFTLPENSGYAFAQGTSMATPHVTGIAALMISKFGKEKPGGAFTSDMLRKRILSAVKEDNPYEYKTDPKFAGKLGEGYIDANIALSDAEKIAPEAPVVSAVDYSSDALKGYYDGKITWQVTADNDAVSGMQTAFAYDIQLFKKGDMANAVFSTTAFSYNKAVGTPMECSFSNLETNVAYVVKVVARDRFDNKSKEAICEFTTRLNHAPKFTKTIGEKLVLLETQSFYHAVLPIVDEDGHSWSYKTTDLPDGVEFKRVGNEFDLLIKVGKPGNFNFTVTLTDELGGKTVQQFDYEVLSHTAPHQIAVLGDVSLFEKGDVAVIDLANVFQATANRDLTFTATSSNELVVKADVSGTELKLTSGNQGTATVTLKVSDGVKTSVVSFQVRVSGKKSSDAYAIYPIPAHSYIKALMHGGVSKVEAVVTNMHGSKVMSETLQVDSKTHEATLGIDRLAPGTYYLLLRTNRVTSKHTFIKK